MRTIIVVLMKHKGKLWNLKKKKNSVWPSWFQRVKQVQFRTGCFQAYVILMMTLGYKLLLMSCWNFDSFFFFFLNKKELELSQVLKGFCTAFILLSLEDILHLQRVCKICSKADFIFGMQPNFTVFTLSFFKAAFYLLSKRSHNMTLPKGRCGRIFKLLPLTRKRL